ncbi:MAG TPA: hypothetical protein VLM37_02005, partial [Fibrobacteraceae bacterium]|nr:hypothetical protein [Fibrobacteraceae bacterium]
MTRRTVKIWTSVAITFFALSGCTDSRSAGGSPGETTNGIVARAVDREGLPMAKAKVYLYDLESLFKLDSAIADSCGFFDLEDSLGIARGLEIFAEDSSAMLWIPNPSAETADSTVYVLNPSRTLLAFPDSNFRTVDTLRILGTPYVGVVHGSGFLFSHLPCGVWALEGDGTYAGMVDLGDTGTIQVTYKVQADSLLIENFDDGDRRPLWATYWPETTWTWWLGLDSS